MPANIPMDSSQNSKEFLLKNSGWNSLELKPKFRLIPFGKLKISLESRLLSQITVIAHIVQFVGQTNFYHATLLQEAGGVGGS